ncbi:MAG: hypothetical protein WAV20_06840 [Blastocatellia bacterium]
MDPKKRGLVLLALLFAASVLMCQAEEKKMKMHKNVKVMKQEIENQIPIGSSIKDAKRIMEANAFKCKLEERGSFAEMGDDERFVRRHDNADFLYCDKEKRGFICSRRWQVAIVHKDTVVSGIFVSISQNCP